MLDPTPAAVAAVHAGELNGTVIGTISAVSGGLARMIAPMLPARWMGLAAAVVLSTASLWIWAYSAYAWSREGSFAIYVGWGVILAATYGIFTGSSADKLSGAANTLSGGRIGTPKE